MIKSAAELTIYIEEPSQPEICQIVGEPTSRTKRINPWVK